MATCITGVQVTVTDESVYGRQALVQSYVTPLDKVADQPY